MSESDANIDSQPITISSEELGMGHDLLIVNRD